MNKLSLIIFVLITTFNSWAQTSSTIYIYRAKKGLTGLVKSDLSFNDNTIASISNGTRLKYTIYSNGTLKIKISGNEPHVGDYQSSVTKNIVAGKSYYFRVSGYYAYKIESVSESVGSSEYNDDSSFKGDELSYSEDSDSPIIEPKNNIVTEIRKTDTIKQIVYVNANKTPQYVYEPISDIDNNIPVIGSINELQFALIIGNEDYSAHQNDLTSEMNVEFARNDASAFKEYALKTLGIPEKNITFLLDATSGQISQGLSKINLIVKNTKGKARIIFYYAGHGLPNEQTKEPYIIPVDVSGSNLASAIKLIDIYSKLTEYPCERVCVFLDACFSGGGRNQGLLSARGVKVKPKEESLKGNLIVLSSSNGEQSSLPYKDKQHGMFTYFLLKKLQETKGDIFYKDLYDYLNEKISLESVLINSREQNPQINFSVEVQNNWDKWKLNK